MKKFGFTLAEVFSPHCGDLRKAAFTLAEVLITLGIIGVVAAMTIPSLIQKQNEKATVVKLKKAYSTLLTAYQAAEFENGDPRADLDWSNANNYKRPFLEKLMPYLNVAIDCKNNEKMCFDQTNSFKGSHKTTLDKKGGSFNSTPSAVLLKDGTLIAIMQSGNASVKHVSIMVDVNGKKAPNAYGHDTFFFIIMSNQKKITPSNAWEYDYKHKYCKLNSPEQATDCAWWVLKNENMDYLHCDLDWKTQTKCAK